MCGEKRYIIVVMHIVLLAVCLSGNFSEAVSLDEVAWWKLQNAGNYINKYHDPKKDVEQVRRERNMLLTALGMPKRLCLQWSTIANLDSVEGTYRHAGVPENITTWIKAPDGTMVSAESIQTDHDQCCSVPSGPDQNGLYLMASCIDAGESYRDTNGRSERTYFFPKAIVGHCRVGSTMKTDQSLALNISEIALEIVPSRASRYIGTIQVGLRNYDMTVLFRGEPLSGATVTVFTEHGWQKSLITNKRGHFEIMPLEGRGVGRDWEVYLYVVSHYDRETGEHYVATLPMLVDPPWPEWRSWHGALIFWTIGGVGFLLIVVIVTCFVNLRQSRAVLRRFEEHTIPKQRSSDRFVRE